MSKLRCRAGIVVAIAALVLTSSVCGPAAAQLAPGVLQPAAQTANVSGTVLKSTGAPIAGAQIRLTAPATELNTVTDAEGRFTFVGVAFGTYRIQATSAANGAESRNDIVVGGDVNIAIRYGSSGAAGKTIIGRVSTASAGASINATAASIASVSPSENAFNGNVSWKSLLNGVPGVALSGQLYGGQSEEVLVPGDPLEPLVPSINGAQTYETATTLDGMPLTNANGSDIGAGFNLGSLPMPLFDSVDIVRGPGANSPTILDSIGGSLVLHGPGLVKKNSFEFSTSNDAYGGNVSNAKATYHAGKLSATLAYSTNNSPGPSPGSGINGIDSPTFINGQAVASGGLSDYGPTQPYGPYGNCYCDYGTSLISTGSYVSQAWSQHAGGAAFSYELSPSITADALYIGSQLRAELPPTDDTWNFEPDGTYTGALPPGNTYIGVAADAVPSLLNLQSGSLLEEKITAKLFSGVLRLAALQDYSYVSQSTTATPPTKLNLFGTGSFCTNPDCTTSAPFVFNGQPAIVQFDPYSEYSYNSSTNDDLLASYELPIGANVSAGVSFVNSRNGYENSNGYSTFYEGSTYTEASVVPMTTQTTNEYRIHVGSQFSNGLGIDASYYIAQATYHVQNPTAGGTGYIDSRFAYSAPRIGLTYRLNRDAVLRASAGGGYALPPLLNLVGTNGTPSCSAEGFCSVNLTNVNLRPETSFGFDIGSDMRFGQATAFSLDLYRTELYNQLYQTDNADGTFMVQNQIFPLYAFQYQNVAHARSEGLTLNLKHDVQRGLYWSSALGLTRGYVVSVPPSFYNQAGTTCNLSTGIGCQNTNVVPNINIVGSQSAYGTIPYANGNAVLGYRRAADTYIDIQANYLGANNQYFRPGFVTFDAHASYSLTKHVALVLGGYNLSGFGQGYAYLHVNQNLLAPTIVGPADQLFTLPYAPRTLTVTAKVKL